MTCWRFLTVYESRQSWTLIYFFLTSSNSSFQVAPLGKLVILDQIEQ